ncbi:MAG: hypothetical protein M5U28_04395 [Sandaracinaceae bacterium]|nr:hypothetical protein [Sandaracinaceae bacterium]
MVAWADSSAVVRTIHVDAGTGALAPSGGQVIPGLDGFSGLDLVRGPTSYLAVGTNGTRAEGAFLDAAGALTGSVFDVYAGAPMLYDIRASFGGADFLAVWRSSTPDVRAARITTTGTVRDPLGVVVSTAGPSFPAVSWDGASWWTAFAAQDGSPTWDAASLFLRRVAPSGALLDTPALAVPDSGWTESRPALSAGSPRTLLVYQRYSPDDGTTRTFARLIDDLVRTGDPCTSDAQCSSGHCVDSVCCDTACGGSAPDCQACSVAAGAPANGTCAILGASHVCRAAAGACDVAETCTGTSATCPINAVRPDGSSCEDGLACDGSETCTSGVCGSAGPLSCDDANLCTTDSCSEPSGCAHAAIGGCCNVAADCDDGDVCTLDVCSGPGGTCSHPTISGCCTTGAMCADASPCTADSCDGATSTCRHTPIPGCCSTSTDCFDGNACTTDTCTAGSCGNAPIAGCCLGDADCDDGNACTSDACSGVGGTCSHTAIPRAATSAATATTGWRARSTRARSRRTPARGPPIPTAARSTCSATTGDSARSTPAPAGAACAIPSSTAARSTPTARTGTSARSRPATRRRAPAPAP